ncbi:TPA: hypothetical protein ACP32N_005040 [Pseudomonas aeruginosa]
MAKREIDWVVSVNGVQVGEVQHEVMEAIRQSVRQDKSTYLAQGSEVTKAGLRMLMGACKIAPAITLGLVMFVAVFSPFDLDLLLIKQTPHFVVKTFATFGYLLAGLVVLGMVAFGHRFGFQDQISVRELRSIRRYLRVPADGDVQLEPVPRHLELPAQGWKQTLKSKVQAAVKNALQAGASRREAEEGSVL